ncbi:MAG: hypothetical protein GY948_06975 [Alphaproteobacteria bacterium]|nr:hypothetical protein [Alphaproteobacteria bacterium]
MKQQKAKQRQRSKKAARQTATHAPKTEDVSRRNMLGLVRNWGLFAAVAAGGGWYLVDEVLATISEQDLTQIGNGTPTVVQIHDPQCSRCLALQREARKAMKAFGGDELQYLVANIRSEKGRALASANKVGHITLLLFDAKGQRRETLHGNNHSGYLELMFRKHVDQYSAESS